MYHIHTKNLLSMKNKTTELVENTQRTVYDTIAIAILFFFLSQFFNTASNGDIVKFLSHRHKMSECHRRTQ